MFVSSVFEVSGFSGSPKEQSHTFKCSFFFFPGYFGRSAMRSKFIHCAGSSTASLLLLFIFPACLVSPPWTKATGAVFFGPVNTRAGPPPRPPTPRRTPRPLSHRHLFAEPARATLCLLNIIGISARGLIKKQLPLAAAGGARRRVARLIWRMVSGERLARRTQRHAKLCLRT